MTSVAKISHDHSVELTLNLLRELTQGDILQRVGVRLWNGTQWPDDELCPTTIVLKHPGALRSMFLPGTEVGLGKAYLLGLAIVHVWLDLQLPRWSSQRIPGVVGPAWTGRAKRPTIDPEGLVFEAVILCVGLFALTHIPPCLAEPGRIIVFGKPDGLLAEVIYYLVFAPGQIQQNRTSNECLPLQAKTAYDDSRAKREA